ncbi:Sodium/hydrogen exchanger 8 [Clydaea vesicula]|uniref:Sodium/hydrogen exchanger n=1 Tax=Clydaea vesicula TaxID=447962 RepID=A0AAD5XXS2_9FUNG|nr:Sodium/hydrogen exchanger 8 [Clydaea vesicula]KAJ3396555.1 Sodium/hydrogen exchanger 8 [Lobulomyces angularis]
MTIENAVEVTLEVPSHDDVSGHDDSTHALYVRSIFMLILIIITINLHGFVHKIKFHYISETALTIILGLVVATLFTTLSYTDENTTIQLSSKFFYMVLLPPIIFEGGFNLRRVSFFKNFLSIFSLAFVGALYSTAVTSILMYYLSKLAFPLSLIESLVFGSMISSTDPVTVLSLLPSTVDRRLYMLIFGESALNDAVSIILYKFFTSIADPKMRLGVVPFILAVLASTGVFIGSFLVGIITALAFAFLTKHVQMADRPIYETTMLLIFAYLSYLIADVIQLTGIISIFFCGIGMAHYAYPNLAKETTGSLKIQLRFISSLCEGFIFIYLGLGLLSFGGKSHYSPSMILFASIAILISRTHVFIILAISNMFAKTSKDKVPLNHQILMWFSGLRGAVAFALGVTFLEHPVFDSEVKGVIFGTTVMVVVLTVVILGGLTPYMLSWLKIVKPEDTHHEDGHGALAKSGDELDKHGETEYKEIENGDEEEGVRNEMGKPSFFGWLLELDVKYIRRYFTNIPVNPVELTLKRGNSKRKDSLSISPVIQKSENYNKGKKNELNDSLYFSDADTIKSVKSTDMEDLNL